MTERLYSTGQAAEALGVSWQTINRWCKAGVLPNAQKVGEPPRAFWVIPQSDLDHVVRPRIGRPRKGDAARASGE